jgi:hypothetical protein
MIDSDTEVNVKQLEGICYGALLLAINKCKREVTYTKNC